MPPFNMLRTFGGNLVSMFPLYPGQINIAAADGAKTCNAIYCVTAGNVTLDWAGGEDNDTLAITEGEVFSFPGGALVTAGAGTVFHFV